MRFDDGIAVAAEGVVQIIGNNEQDVGPAGLLGNRRKTHRAGGEENEKGRFS